jgi:hypothetical protein
MNKNKVAVLLSGHVRSYESLQQVVEGMEENLIKINPEYDFKFFMHTWNFLDWNHDGTVYCTYNTESQKILDIINLEKLSITENKNPILVNNDDRTHGQYTSVNECNKLKKEFENKNFSFDISIRTRCDLKICEPLDLSIIDTSCFNITNDAFGFADWFCVSSSKLIDYYSDLILNLESLVDENLKYGCYGKYSVDQHHLLLLHLKKIKHGLSFDDFVDLKINSEYNKSYEKDAKEIENYVKRIDFLYYLIRSDGRPNDTFKKGYR